ncbi:MAG: NIPSNAP family protein [Bacteroidia bacterium]|nr:NIPSNAP family protein [Bacteroidia bacterium]
MKNSKNILRTLTTLLLFVLVPFSSLTAAPKQMYYEVKIFRISGTAQEAMMDAYLKDAFIPAMHRAGISTIGVFKPIEKDTAYGKLVYVFIPLKTVDQYLGLEAKLNSDQAYQQAGKDFLDAPYKDPPFVRYESILLKAFTHMPQFRVPTYTTPAAERIYELRSYESATEAKAAKKIQMFNEGGEIAIFEKIGANAVFYAQVLVGSQKPRLMYMTTYADMKSHDDRWAAFRNSPEWKTLSAKEEYKNSTSKTKPFLLHPTDYSDF